MKIITLNQKKLRLNMLNYMNLETTGKICILGLEAAHIRKLKGKLQVIF